MKSATIIVAHPDDETLWAGGTVLSHPNWDWKIYSLTRSSDPDRSKRFSEALFYLGAAGDMADLDDEPELDPIDPAEVKEAMLDMVESQRVDLVLTHGPRGEYTRHIRHEEVSGAVRELWMTGELKSDELWFFAYEDGGREYLPRPERGAEINELPDEIWRQKRHLIEDIYGFDRESWEARACPRIEAFYKFKTRSSLEKWFNGGCVP